MDTDEDSTTDDELDEFNFNQHPWEDSEDSEEQDIYYIIEPQDGGSLYIYGDGRPLEKLPFSVKEIVNNSPFRTPDGTTYIGRKNTLMIEIDPRNGKILQQIDLNKADNQYRMATQYPPRTIFLGRNEYKVAIYDSNKKWWNVTYSEYIPNKFDWDVPTNTVPSDIYIAPDATLAITGINVRNGELIWSRDLPHPVVSVFDVYRREDYTIALSKQVPPPTLTKGDVGDLLSLMTRKNNVTSAYVGVHEGSLYALSTKNYPLVQISPWASMYTGRKPGDTSQLIGGSSTSDANATGFEWTQKPHEMCCHGCEYHIDCMIGQHVVQSVVDEIVEEDHIFRYKLALPSASASSLPTGLRQSLPTNIPLYPGLDDMKDFEDQKSSFFKEGFGKFWKSYVLVSSVIVYVYRDHIITFYEVKVLPKWKQMLKKRAKAKKTKARIAAAARAEKEMIKRERADSLTSIGSFDADRYIKEKIDEQIYEKEQQIKKLREEEEAIEKQKKAEEEAKAKAEELIAAAAREEEEKLKSSSVVVKQTSTGLDLESFKQSKSRVLEISDHVLGYGSHGTVVYKGSFDGRNVAVKRLLLDFYDVALKEVKLLQESDDHPNVVRYFYKEESDRFLYIALELCYGSLNDYMERSLPIPEMQLCDTMNPANILSQFISGLQYLHSLKIVHRDIKPHNILLAPSKHRYIKDSPVMRILISDFGLCKKLDGEQSSFNYTAASPAGTSGWRAPELLAGALAATSSDTSFSSTRESSSDGSSMIGRVKATRAIDIFSAGCVFYYVLSGGDHPFGNRFGRENNILNGNYNLDKLDSMGEDGVEAKDLVERMISSEPKSRLVFFFIHVL
ncbi:kinase-like domain-containing protein [Helicostylum pulchrum]|nr:kinase-like domain-containing protein [Helicostylum pulchrum]